MASQVSKNFYQVVKNAPKGRFQGIKRNYGVEDVLKLRGSVDIEYTLATRGANKLWQLLHTEPFVPALGAQTGNQAVQMVRAGLQAIYLSGWQVAADANSAGEMYPDQSLYPANSGPELARRINKSLRRADQIEAVESEDYRATRDWYAPIVADAEAGFGGALNCFELMKSYIDAGAAGVHYEDQLGSEKKCGHMGGKVLIPTAQHIRHLNAARLAADVCGVPTIIVARTDAESSRLLTSDIDERDHPFIDRSAGRTIEGFHRLRDEASIQYCIQRAINYAPYSDLIWMETSHPTLADAKEFSEGVRKVYPDKMFAYNCSPSFNWKQHLSPTQMEKFQKELGAMGFKYQFITLAGYHTNSFSIFDLSRGYKDKGMLAYSNLQEQEFASEKYGYSAVKHQREVGTGYFDHVANASAGGSSSTTALTGSTEEAQFHGTRTASSEDEEIVTSTAPLADGDERILSPDALRFIKDLHENFNGRRKELLKKRKEVQNSVNNGEWFPDFDKNTKHIREDGGWQGSEIPQDLLNRRVEITGPTDRKMVINAFNSGANVFMADFEDSNSPTWRNQIDGQINLYDAIRDAISYLHPATKKEYTLNKDHAVLKVRPRGWHLPEKHLLVNGKATSGSLVDFGLFFFHNAKHLVEKGSGPYFYLPKLQSAEEAQLWADVFAYSEDRLGFARGTIKCTVLIEHILASFQMNEIIYALKNHIVGLNCGRWDYIFSYIKTFQNHRKFLLPDRFQIGMTSPFLRSYTQEVIKTCHQRGIHAMGGMAAQIPIRHDEIANSKALALVRADKEREATDGHDGTWVAHPGLVPIAKEVFDNIMPSSNQIDKILSITTTNKDLTAVPKGTRSEAGFRKNISVTLSYLDSWLRGIGCVPLYNLMEDAATAEISRAQLWQWLRHDAKLEDGRTIDPSMVRETIAAELERKMIRAGSVVTKLPQAAEMLEKFATEEELSDFLTLDAYDKLVAEGH